MENAMHAAVVRDFGDPGAIEIVDVPTPGPGPGQVRIRVQAAAVNPVDAFVRSGDAIDAGLVPRRDLLGLGCDLAGSVDAVGEGVAKFAVGDAVIGISDRLDRRLAGYAEYIVLDADAVAVAPRKASAVEASTLPLNGLAATQALDMLDLQPGQTVLVTGAAGAVGGYVVELATTRGLRVAATASGTDEALVRGFGAEWFVPRGTESVGEAVRRLVPGGVDGVVDAASLSIAVHDALRDGGTFVALIAGAAPPALRGTAVHTVFVRAEGSQLSHLVALVDSGKLTLRVAETLPLAKAAVAHRRLAEGGLRGRLVLIP
jgi:NADPH:quinone reductase-like Zn-dependent oxidoreductase